MNRFVPPNPPELIIPSDRRRVLIAWNPKAGAGPVRKQIQRIQAYLEDGGLWCDTSTDLNEVSDIAHKWYEKGDLRAVLGSGGDGTVRELAERSPVGTPITVFPAGTANLLSKYLWRRRRVSAETIADAVIKGHACRFDAGLANGRLFVLMCSCGFDATVVTRLHSGREGHIGYLSYAKPLIETCRAYEYPEMAVYCPDTGVGPKKGSLRTRWAFAFNFPCYAVGSGFAASAEPKDGILDLCTFGGIGMLPALQFYFRTVLNGEPLKENQHFFRARRVRFASAATVHYQIDGDPGGTLPVEIETLPNRLTLIVPPVGGPISVPTSRFVPNR